MNISFINATEPRKWKNISAFLRASVATTLVLLIQSCSSAPEVDLPEEIASLENVAVFSGDIEPLHEIELIPETVYGDTDDVLLSDWLMVHVDPRGRVFIGDNRQTAIHLFNPDGSYSRRIGGEGDGPGEYRAIGVMQSDENYFYHYDMRNRRITRYDTDTFDVISDLTVSVPSDEESAFPQSFSSFSLTSDRNRMLAHLSMGFRAGRADADPSERRIRGMMMHAETGEFTGEEVYNFPASEALVHHSDGSMSVMSVPYKRSSVVQIHGDGIIHGWNEHFLFKYYDLNGEYQRAVYYDYENPPLNRNEILEDYRDRTEPWKSMVENDNMPATWPSWTTFMPDDEGRLWVQRRTADTDVTQYHVLDSNGELLTVFPWNPDNRIQKIRDGYLWSLEQNEDGLREVVRYGFSLES
jgi:hypothetical protein